MNRPIMSDPRGVALAAKRDGRRFRARFVHDNDVAFDGIVVEAGRMLETYGVRDVDLANLYKKRFTFWALMVPGSDILPPGWEVCED